jgi:small subunit ribosomal protein S9
MARKKKDEEAIPETEGTDASAEAVTGPEPEATAETPETTAETPEATAETPEATATEPATEAPEAAQAEEPEQEEPQAEEPEAPMPAEPEPEPVQTLVELAADARYSATGKRKSSVARVILLPGSGAFVLNGKPLDGYFPRRTLQEVVRQPLKATGYLDRVDIRARIHGGGISSQADAVRHGIAKALIEADPNLRGELKRRQLLTRDPRVKERRKAGLKKARKRPQFSKR